MLTTASDGDAIGRSQLASRPGAGREKRTLWRFITVASFLNVRAALSLVEAAVLPCRHGVARRGDRIGRRMMNSKLSVLSVAAKLLLWSPGSGVPEGWWMAEAPQSLEEVDEPALGSAVALDIVLGMPEAAMASEQLNVAD